MSRYIRPRDIELSPQERQTLISKIRHGSFREKFDLTITKAHLKAFGTRDSE